MNAVKCKHILFCTGLCLLFSSCKMVREMEVTLPALEGTVAEAETGEDAVPATEYAVPTTGDIVHLTQIDIDRERYVKTFLGMTLEEAELQKPKREYADLYYEIGSSMLLYDSGFVEYAEGNEGAAGCYSIMVDPYQNLYEGLGYGMRERYPEEDIKNCTKEEAMAICRPYAQVCGYSDEHVSCYALTLDVLENLLPSWGRQGGAPVPGLPIVTRDELNDLYDQGKDEEAVELINKTDPLKYEIPWSEKDEALILIYQTEVNGLVLDSCEPKLVIVYAPQYGKPVYVKGQLPYEADYIMETKELISREQALSTAMQSLGVMDQSDITVAGVELVYSLEAVRMYEESTADPCWKIDYTLAEGKVPQGVKRCGSIKVDAVTGYVSVYSQ